MPSAADARTALRREGLLRGAALAALTLALVAAWWRQRAGGDAGARAVHVEVAGGVSGVQRDSLAALARAGRRVSWSGPVAAVMAVAEPVREPVRRWRVSAVGDGALVARDSLGPIDSLQRAATLTTEPTRGPLQVAEAGTVAEAAGPVPLPPRGVLVLGRVGWEPRFAITALEEAGWRVDARLELGRGRSVTQGQPRLDRARHDVAVVFDTASAAREAGALRRFVAAGGGLVLAGEATQTLAPALRDALPARARALLPPETRDFEEHGPTHALPLFGLAALRADAVLLDDRDGVPAVAARRVGAGRVLQMGYAETWRWRMQGEGRSVDDHRAWWSRLAGMAAAASSPRVEASAFGSAPRAALVHALGDERPAPRRADAALPALPWWLGSIILILLLAEWASRRRRGIP
jgi:hypothetical protein